MTRILIADDHELILEGLKKTLDEVASDIVGANSFDTAVAALNGNAFDFCVIDHELNPGRGDKLLEKVRETMPRAKAISRTTNAPSAPASVGVAQPIAIAEKMIATTAKIGIVPGSVAMRSLNGGDGMRGPSDGLIVHWPMIRSA